MNKAAIAASVQQVYNWIDDEVANNTAACDACGKCCNFQAYDHRLYVTSPEMIHFTANVGKVKPMTKGYCPYLHEGKCTVHPFRFAGCRIFLCTGDSDLQSRLSEEALEKLKEICEKFDIEYYYTDLKTALNKSAD
jgi:Fe-S-cluster containining protein